MVLLGHTLLFIPGPGAIFKVNGAGRVYVDTWLDLFPTRILWSQHQAVVLFFVLSGFALYLMLESIRKDNTSVRALYIFALSRWLRLYPVYVFSIGFAMLTYWAVFHSGVRYLTNHFTLAATFDLNTLIGHLLLVGDFDVTRYNVPIWSIVQEMRISLLFPLIYYSVQRLGTRVLWPTAAVPAITVLLLLSYPHLERFQAAMSVLSTLNFAVFFVVGAVIARWRDTIVQRVRALSRVTHWSILGGSLLLYTYVFDVTWYDASWPAPLELVGDFFIGVGACGMIILALSFPVLERSAILKRLGKMSYSVYLMHFTCVAALYELLGARLPYPLVACLMIGIALAVAGLTWRLVEVRSLNWSREVRVSGPKVAVPQGDTVRCSR
jgi:peptidoglycan/LPS O-acetylase OafA/YrhL